jgi:hypothetical protein
VHGKGSTAHSGQPDHWRTLRHSKGHGAPARAARRRGGGSTKNLDALIGVFVPAKTVNLSGFSALDGTKAVAAVGIIPNGLFFIGYGKTLVLKQAGTLFLGINDFEVGDNGGGFTVTVTVH